MKTKDNGHVPPEVLERAQKRVIVELTDKQIELLDKLLGGIVYQGNQQSVMAQISEITILRETLTKSVE